MVEGKDTRRPVAWWPANHQAAERLVSLPPPLVVLWLEVSPRAPRIKHLGFSSMVLQKFITVKRILVHYTNKR